MAAKQAIVMRADLRMGKGKAAAQAAHASILAYLQSLKRNPELCAKWLQEGQKKVVLKVKSQEELLALYDAMRKEVPCALVSDAGLTQLEPGSITCFGAGPADEKKIDKHLGNLKLL
ncbi:MAG: peptidyl-tRNA hydrolase Pth2 [Candidatus Micrarchaeota archaeon]|nr:peptidyl-tRNA hydrolase Pth2 [Candidatus Micrarchaeota archaeon]